MFKLFSRKVKAPEHADVFDVKETLKYTPDAALLEMVTPWLIFICDDLQSRHPRHPKLIKAGAYNPNSRAPEENLFCYTLDKFVLWKYQKQDKTFPIPLDTAPKLYQNPQEWDLVGPQAHNIKGQLWAGDWRTIAELDEHYRNTVEYERRAIHLVSIYHEEIMGEDGGISVSLRQEKLITAYMYVGIQSFWDEIMDGEFHPVKKFPRRADLTPTYYFFTKLEYNK